MLRYQVLVDDNYHFMDPDERYEHGVYETVEDALAVCRRLVDLSLKEGYRPGMSAESLCAYYRSFGDDPFITVLGGVNHEAKFSAWEYAEQRSKELCEGGTP